MFANCAIALGILLVRWGQVLAVRAGHPEGAPPILSGGMGTLFSYLSVSNLSIHEGRVRNWSKLVEQG